MYICNTFALLKICELQKSALRMEKHCWILEKIMFSHLGRYSYWSVQNPLYSVAKFWFSSIIAFQWAIGGQKRTAGSWNIIIQQCLYVLPETCMSTTNFWLVLLVVKYAHTIDVLSCTGTILSLALSYSLFLSLA